MSNKRDIKTLTIIAVILILLAFILIYYSFTGLVEPQLIRLIEVCVIAISGCKCFSIVNKHK